MFRYTRNQKLMQKNEIKIVSGGQTGVDRGGLQAAMDLELQGMFEV